MNAASETPARRMPRWARITLIVSLAANLAIAGVVGGALLRGPDRDRPLYLPIDGFRAISEAMPQTARDALRQDLRGRRDEIRNTRQALQETHRAFISAVRAEPFSAEAVNAVLDEQADRWQQFSNRNREMLVRHIARMSPEARAQFAANFEEQLKHRPRHKDKNKNRERD